MKKFLLLALTAIMALGLASCNRQEIDPPREGVQGKYLLTEITASTGEDDTKTALQSSGVVNWSADDQIAVKGTDGELHYYVLRYGKGTPVGRFIPATGQSPASYNTLSDLTAIYPACAAELQGGEMYVNINNLDLSGSFTDIGLTIWTQDSPFIFSNNDIKVAIPNGSTQENGKINLIFKQLGTCCEFIIDFTQADQAQSLMLESVERIQVTTLEGVALGGRAKLEGTSLGELTNPLTTIDWSVMEPMSMSSLIRPMFVFYPEVKTNTTLKITLTTTEHEFVFTGKPTQDFEAGKSLTFPVTVDKNFTVGGTKLAYTSSPRSVDPFYYYGGTNCLLLRTENEIGYLDVTQYVTDSYWHNTKNTADVQTPRPAAYAKIIWSEASDVIASATVNGSAYGYKLKMAESAAGATDAISTDSAGKSFLAIKRGSTAGNALVGIYDASDELLWSYHIWCPTEDPTAGMHVYTQTNSGSYTVMTMPIGAMRVAYSGMDNPQSASGLYYQWGRKDPLGRPTDYSDYTGGDILNVLGPDQSTSLNTGSLGYGISGGNLRDCEIWFRNTNNNAAANNTLYNAWNASGKTRTLGRFVIDYTITKPWAFILGGGDELNWTEADDNFWGNGDSNISYPEIEETYKSIFDPSPEGYRVAPEDLWVSFTKTHANAEGATDSFKTENFNVSSISFTTSTKANGYTFYYQGWKTGDDKKQFYLTSGYRTRGGGAITEAVNSGNYWSSRPVAENRQVYSFKITSKSVSPRNSAARNYGYPVICVKEQ